LELERKASELRQAVSGKPSLAGGPLDEGQVAASPVVLYEIGGSGDRLTATFRMADGQLREFVPDQTVKGFGRIKAIWPQAVEDDKGRFHSVSPLPEAIR
jgi:hypothetical protein